MPFPDEPAAYTGLLMACTWFCTWNLAQRPATQIPRFLGFWCNSFKIKALHVIFGCLAAWRAFFEDFGGFGLSPKALHFQTGVLGEDSPSLKSAPLQVAGLEVRRGNWDALTLSPGRPILAGFEVITVGRF